jgi:diacylglycerol kinase (ATP)
MRRRFLLVHNPIAGLDGRRLVHEVTAGLQHIGADVTRFDGAPRELPAVLQDRASSIDAVIAAGGDGTIRALAALLEPYGLPLGVVPMGTGNVLAHEIGLPSSAVGLADLLLRGPVHEFEGARANGEPFFLMAGVGFDGQVIGHLDTPLKRRIGKAAYVSPFIKTLRAERTTLDVEVDGARHQAQWVVAANGRRYGGAFIIAPQAGLERPGLVAVLIKNAGQLGLLRQLLALGTGRLHRASGVEMIPCTRLTVHSAGPVASQIDGDPFVATPLEISAGGARVRLIVPEAYAARLPQDEDHAA